MFVNFKHYLAKCSNFDEQFFGFGIYGCFWVVVDVLGRWEVGMKLTEKLGWTLGKWVMNFGKMVMNIHLSLGIQSYCQRMMKGCSSSTPKSIVIIGHLVSMTPLPFSGENGNLVALMILEGSKKFACFSWRPRFVVRSLRKWMIWSSRWWFQPIWKILVKMGIFPK